MYDYVYRIYDYVYRIYDYVYRIYDYIYRIYDYVYRIEDICFQNVIEIGNGEQVNNEIRYTVTTTRVKGVIFLS